MPSFQMHPGFAGQSIRTNPWKPTQFIISTSQNFGIVGSGKAYVVEAAPGFQAGSPVSLVGCWGTSDGVFDACFSEVDQNIVVTACGDGVKVYNLAMSLNRDGVIPLVHNAEHQAEVSCVVWNSGRRDTFYSASWDTTIKMYSAVKPEVSMVTMQEHFKEVYEVASTAHSPSSILSCSGDGSWKLWDNRSPQRSVLTQMAHQNQIVLSIDFCKSDPNIFASGGVDRTVRVWDARRPNQPLASFPGHDQACRRVRFSTHNPSMLASSGYDMRVCVWDLSKPQQPLTARYQHHREFVAGLEWSQAAPNALASASYDGSAFFWSVGQAATPSLPTQQLPPAVPPPRVPRPRTKVLAGLPQPSMPMPMAATSPPRSPRIGRSGELFSMLARTSSPGGSRPGSRRHNNANTFVHNPLNFSVQDRRLNTRLLKETQRRKAQLLGMTRHDVARQLQRYTVPPSSIMDEGHRGGPSTGKSASHTKSATGGRKSASGTGADAASAVSFPLGIHSEAGESSSSSRDFYSRLQAQYAQHLQKKKDTVNYPLNSPTSPGEDDERTDSVPSVPPTASYEEWLSAGCPTGSWSVLLQEEVYAPLEAERAFLIAKYNPEERPQS